MVALKTILLVENDPVALKMYRDRLQREGFNVEAAEDGRAGLKVMMDVPIDLLILDLMLPKLSGADVLNYMRMIPALEEVPVIILSNAPENAVSEEVMAKGPTKRLVKADCTFPMLLEAIQQMLPQPGGKPAASTKSGSENNDSPAPAAQPENVDRPSSPPAVRSENSAGDGTFPKGCLGEMPKIREHCFAYLRAPASPESKQHLTQFQQRVRAVGKDAMRANAAKVSILTNALDSLLSEITTRPSGLTPSMLQTIAQATDCLDSLLRGKNIFTDSLPKVAVLAVDDDAICNRVMASALKRSSFEATIADDPNTALKLLEVNHYDLILLDVNMPGLTGFELCNKLRGIPHCKTTPVVFITAQNDLGNRKQSVLSGGDDFIPKPIVPSELILKLTVHLLRSLPQREAPERQEPVSAKATANAAAAAESGSQNSSNGQTVATVPAPSSRMSDAAPVVREESRGTETPELTPAEPVFANKAEDALQAASPATERASNTIVIMPSTVTQTIHSPGGTTEESASLQAAPSTPPTARREPEVAAQDQLIDQLRLMRNERDELGGKLKAEIQTTAGLRKEMSDLQNQVRTSADALEKSTASLQKKSEEIAGAQGALEQVQTLAKEREAWCSRLHEDVNRLQKDRDELSRQLVAEQTSTANSNHEVEALRRHKSELDLINRDLQERCTENTRAIAETSERLNAANIAREKAELALKNREAECTQLDEKLIALGQEIGGLRSTLIEREQNTAKSAQEAKAQEELLQELEKINADLKHQISEQTDSASKLRQELNASVEDLAQARKALREQEARCDQLESDLKVLKEEGSQLRSRVAAEMEMSARSDSELENVQQTLRRRTEELESAKADHQQAVADKTQAESELRNELKAMIDRVAHLQERRAEDEVRCRLLSQDVISLRQERDEDRRTLRAREEATARSREETEQRETALQQRLSELERGTIDLKRELSDQNHSEAKLREELNATIGNLNLRKEASERSREEAEQRETALRQRLSELERAKTDLERELAEQNQSELKLREELNTTVGDLNLKKEAAKRLREETEQRQTTLQQRVSELERAKTDLERELSEQSHAEAKLREELNVTSGNLNLTKEALTEKGHRCSQLDGELAAAKQQLGELSAKWTAEQEAATGLRRELDALGHTVQQRTSELDAARAEVEARFADRERLELELRSHIQTAGVAIEQFKKTQQDHLVKINDLTLEVAVRMLERDDLRDQLVLEQGVSAELRRQSEALRETTQRIAAELQFAKSELARAAAERSQSNPVSREEQNANHNDPAQTVLNFEQQTPERRDEESQPVKPADATTPSSSDQNNFAAPISSTVPEPQVFRLIAPGAICVLLIGEFTEWQMGPIPMQEQSDGSWVATVDLKPGRYEYLFMVDGVLHCDMDCSDRIVNPFGGYNNVRRVV